MKKLIYIFYLEVLITGISAVQCLFAPQNFVTQLTPGTQPAITLELARWYGVLLSVLIFLLIQGLRLRGPALKLTLQAMLFGDVLQIIATFVTAISLAGWSFTLIMSVGLSIIYGILRAICLLRPIETGVDNGIA